MITITIFDRTFAARLIGVSSLSASRDLLDADKTQQYNHELDLINYTRHLRAILLYSLQYAPCKLVKYMHLPRAHVNNIIQSISS